MKVFCQKNETDRLKTVIVGRWKGYREVEAYTEIVNADQEKGLPEIDQLQSEFENFQKALEAEGVEVRIPDYVGKFVYDQLTPRDIAVTIDNKLVLCNMVKKSRRYESAGIFPLLEDFSGDEPDVLLPPSGCFLEGGDIMVDKGRILVGISQRSNLDGFEWLREQFGDQYEVHPVQTTKPEKGENVLHLDCTFNPVGKNHALIYPEGFAEIPPFIKDSYTFITVNRVEQQALATNVLSVDQETVIARTHPDCARVNDKMREVGLRVIEVNFDGAPQTGGSFRCCTMPLIRE
jgi:N-dimethylarginine dimethylaminohydrolase